MKAYSATATIRLTGSSILAFLLLLAVSGPTATATAQIVVYEQDFDNTSGANKALNTIGWNGYITTSATDVSAATTFTNPYATVANGTPGISYLAFGGSTSVPIVAMVTGLNIVSPTTISWDMNANATGTFVQLLVQVSGSWYISAATYTPTDTTGGAAALASDSFSTTFTTTAANWKTFTLNPGTGMSIGTTLSSDLSSSTITGIGFYETGSSGATIRIDTLQVSALSVPEPKTTAMLYLGGSGLLLVAARRRFLKSSRRTRG